MIRWFRRKFAKRTSEIRTDAREQAALERELAESAKSAMASNLPTVMSGPGENISGSSGVSRVVNGRGIEAIGLRRISENREGWPKADRDEL